MTKKQFQTKIDPMQDWISKFDKPFDATKEIIDLRGMSENYDKGMIPVMDIAEGINLAIGDSDPLKVNDQNNPDFKWVPVDKIRIQPKFQRDVSPKHIKKIEKRFDSRKYLVPTAIYRQEDDVYCVWDGSHTIQELIRKGWKTIPLWYTTIEQIDETEMKQSVDPQATLAGESMICINKTIKRPLEPYDQFMIELETNNARTEKCFNIMQKNNCQPRRYKKEAGDVTHFGVLWHSYDKHDRKHPKGKILDRILAWHRSMWPEAEIEAEILRPMSNVFEKFLIEFGELPSDNFDKLIGEKMIELWGSAKSTQLGIKANYVSKFGETGRDDDATKVTNGILNLYDQCVDAKDKEKFPKADFWFEIAGKDVN